MSLGWSKNKEMALGTGAKWRFWGKGDVEDKATEVSTGKSMSSLTGPEKMLSEAGMQSKVIMGQKCKWVLGLIL